MTDLRGTVSTKQGRWTLLAACVAAGACSVPLDRLGTPIAAIGAGVMGWVALWVWEWSRLPAFMRSRTSSDQVWRVLKPLEWLTLGLLVGLVVLAVIRLMIEPVVPSIGMRIAAAGELPIWRRVIIIYVAAVIEELIFRVLLMSAIVGLTIRFVRPTTVVPRPDLVWTAIVAAALAFGAAHLPSWSSAASRTAMLTLAVVALNAIVGLVMGYVFTTRGIGPAMWTHAGGDCAIQLIGPLTG